MTSWGSLAGIPSRALSFFTSQTKPGPNIALAVAMKVSLKLSILEKQVFSLRDSAGEGSEELEFGLLGEGRRVVIV